MGETTQRKATQFCAGALFSYKEMEECQKAGQEEGWRILGVGEDVSSKVKLPGGTNENALWETEEQTFLRELAEETGFLPKKYVEVSRTPLAGHEKVFNFISDAQDTQGYLAVGQVRQRKESDGRMLKARWYTIAEFAASVLGSHREGFTKSMEKMADLHTSFREHLLELARMNSKFYMDYMDLIDKLSV